MKYSLMICAIRFSVIEALMKVKISKTCGKIGTKTNRSKPAMMYTVYQHVEKIFIYKLLCMYCFLHNNNLINSLFLIIFLSLNFNKILIVIREIGFLMLIKCDKDLMKNDILMTLYIYYKNCNRRYLE